MYITQTAPTHSEADQPFAFPSEPSLWIRTNGCRSHGDGGREVDHCSPAARVCGEHRPTNQVIFAASRQHDSALKKSRPVQVLEIALCYTWKPKPCVVFSNVIKKF